MTEDTSGMTSGGEEIGQRRPKAEKINLHFGENILLTLCLYNNMWQNYPPQKKPFFVYFHSNHFPGF